MISEYPTVHTIVCQAHYSNVTCSVTIELCKKDIFLQIHREIEDAERKYIATKNAGDFIRQVASLYRTSTKQFDEERDDWLIDAIENQDEEDLLEAAHLYTDAVSEYEDDYEHLSDADTQVDCCGLCAHEAHQFAINRTCGHMACLTCLTKLKNTRKTCPYCRHNVDDVIPCFLNVVVKTRKVMDREDYLEQKQAQKSHPAAPPHDLQGNTISSDEDWNLRAARALNDHHDDTSDTVIGTPQNRNLNRPISDAVGPDAVAVGAKV